MTNKSSSTLLEAHELLKTKLWVDLTNSFANAFISIGKGFPFFVATFRKPKNDTGFPAQVFEMAKATHVAF